MATTRDAGEQGLGPLLRSYRERLERLETKQTVTVGPFLMTVSELGQLVARHLPTGVEKVLFDPNEEVDPEA